MTVVRSDSVEAHFNAHARDLTAESAQCTSQVFYVPVSDDPEITLHCSLLLSAQEQTRASDFSNPADKALFIQRRAFRRYCAAVALESSQPLSTINFVETANGWPYLSDQPQLCFSFSSCRYGFLGAWSSTHIIGVDIEDKTKDPGTAALARQFFSAAEARTVEAANEMEGRQKFFRFWSLKEAALKCIGQGLPFGLDAFVFELEPQPRIVHAPSEYGGSEQYKARVIDSGEHCTAIVIRNRL
jgi:4'-phosphopantetheinyl transferase